MSPPPLLRLLPAGAIVAGWDLHPLKMRALSRRTESFRLVVAFTNAVTYYLSVTATSLSPVLVGGRRTSRVRHKHLRPADVPEASRTPNPRVSIKWAFAGGKPRRRLRRGFLFPISFSAKRNGAAGGRSWAGGGASSPPEYLAMLPNACTQVTTVLLNVLRVGNHDGRTSAARSQNCHRNPT